MTTYNFTGANGDPLPSGLTARNGTFEIQSNKLFATGADPSGPKWVATGSSTSDGTFSCVVNGEGTTSATTGPVCRYLNNDNHWSALLNPSNGVLKLFKRESGSYSTFGTDYTIPAFSGTTNYKISIITSGTSIKCQVDDVDVITDAGAQSFNQTETLAGLRIGNTSHSIDTLTVPDAATSTLTITTQNYRIWQRTGSDNASVTVTGTYSGTPTTIEKSVDGGAYATAIASPSGNAFSDTFTLSTGQYSIVYRFSNDTSVNDTVTFISVGDVFAMAGQSNMSGRGTSNQTFANSSGGITACLFGNDDNYKVLADPYDSDTGQVDSVSSDSTAAGSWIPRLANQWLANNEIPIGFIPCAKGSTSIADWARSLLDSTLYGSMKRRIDSVGGIAGVFFQQGERDSADAVSTASAAYTAALEQLADDVNSDFGVKLLVPPLQVITAASYTNQGVIRQAQLNAASNVNCKILQRLDDIDLSGGDGLHFQTDTELNTVGVRVYQSYIGSELTTAITGMTDGTYQTIITSGLDTLLNNTLTYVSGATTTPALSVAASTSVIGFAIDNEGTHVNGAVITGTTV
jgi:hypothetical protein